MTVNPEIYTRVEVTQKDGLKEKENTKPKDQY